MSSRRRRGASVSTIIDVFGSTEGAIALDRSGGPPRGSVGRLREGIAVVDADGERGPESALRRRGPAGQRRGVCGRDRQHPRGGTVRGVLPQRRSHAPHHAQRLVLERRPRLRGRRRLGLLRRAHVRLAAGGRRELPGRSDRGHRGPPPRRHDGLGLRRARRRFRRSGHGGPGAARRSRASTARPSPPGWTGNPISAPSGGRASSAGAKRFPPPRPTRSSPARSSTRSSGPIVSVGTRSMCACRDDDVLSVVSPRRTKTPCARPSSRAVAAAPGTCDGLRPPSFGCRPAETPGHGTGGEDFSRMKEQPGGFASPA